MPINAKLILGSIVTGLCILHHCHYRSGPLTFHVLRHLMLKDTMHSWFPIEFQFEQFIDPKLE